MRKTLYNDRPFCYHCYRSHQGCVCDTFKPITTHAHFVLLMHGKEYRKTKNGTGHFTHRNLTNSSLFVGVDFTHHTALNTLLNDSQYQPYVLYPSEDAITIDTLPTPTLSKRPLYILIDSTWACSKSILRQSKNLHNLPRLSFKTNYTSQFKIKRQPMTAALSTIEATYELLSQLQQKGHESIDLTHFLDPFTTMVNFQLTASKEQSLRI